MNCSWINLLIKMFLFILLFDCNSAYEMISSVCKKMRYQQFGNNSETLYQNDVDLSDYSSNRISRESERDSFDPLFLTPLLEERNISEIISLSRVKEPLSTYESYSGFFTVNETYKSHLFFWFFPCVTNYTNASLVVWLEGGSQYPSSSRVFNTLGPYGLQGGKIKKSAYNLLQHFHVLYIDSPVGTGFSYAEDVRGYSRTTQDAAIDVVEAMTQFQNMFPEYMENGIYFTGEMYMSKIALKVAHLIHYEENSTLGIKGLMLPNAFIDPIHMIESSKLLYYTGIVDWNERDELQGMENEIIRFIRSEKYLTAYERYQRLLSMMRNYGYEHPYDFTHPLSSNKYQRFPKILSIPAIRRAIHASHLEYNDMQTAFCYLEHDILRSAKDEFEELTVIYDIYLYTGQFGVQVNTVHTNEFLKKLRWPGAVRFKYSDFCSYCVDEEIIGFKKSADHLNYMVLRNTSNMDLNVNPKWIMCLWYQLAGIESSSVPLTKC